MNKLLKLIFLILLISFLSLYFSKYYINYNDNKNILTDEAIKRFEKDLKSGKKIDSRNYIKEEKDYNNKISTLGIKTSNLIEYTFKKGIKYIIDTLEKME